MVILSSIIMPTMWVFLKQTIVSRKSQELEFSRWFYSANKAILVNIRPVLIKGREYTVRLIQGDLNSTRYEIWNNEKKLWEKTVIH
jgi:hypothetical protein